MAFAQSASGPGGLSINTASANTFGSNQAPPTTSLFGAIGSTSDKQGTGATGGTGSGPLFGALSTSQAPSSGSIFGTSTTTAQTPSLFGAQPSQQGGISLGSQANNSQPQQGGAVIGSTDNEQQRGSIFGSTNAQQSQPPQSGSIFGASLGQAQNQNQSQGQDQQQQSGNLFGALGSNQNKPSLFGTTLNQSQPAQQNQQQTSLFPSLSSSTNANAQQQTSRPSLFGATSTTSAPQQPSLFGGGISGGMSGGMSSGLGSGLGSGLSLGQSTQPQTVPGVRIDVANLRGTTRFGDLHEELQKEIEKIDEFIQSQISLKEAADGFMPGLEQRLSYLPNDVDYVSKKLDTMHNALENDAEAIDHVRKIVKKDAADAKLSFRSIDNLKLPQQYHYAGLWNAPPSVFRSNGPTLPGEAVEQEGSTDLVSYFSTQAEAMTKTLEMYKQNVREIETHLLGVEANTMQQIQQLMFARGRDGSGSTREDQVRELVAVLREFESGILGVAGKVGGVREGVQELELREQNGRSLRVF